MRERERESDREREGEGERERYNTLPNACEEHKSKMFY
jgi:hypothetical protein